MMQPPLGQRIIIIGSSNAGKSTLATRLSDQLRLPWTDLDALHWEPGWVQAAPEVFEERVLGVTSGDGWILAGNYLQKQQHVSWPRADTIVWIDLDVRTTLTRCLRRSWRRWRTQEDLFGGNREVFWDHLRLWDTDRSLLAHIVRTHRRRRVVVDLMSRDPIWSHLTFIRLRSADQVEAWLSTLDSTCIPGSQHG